MSWFCANNSTPALSERGAEKKNAVVLLRWVLIITCSCLILFQSRPVANAGVAHGVILFLIFSNLVLAFFPSRIFVARFFDHVLLVGDIVLVTSGMWLAGNLDNELYIVYFVVIMIAAVSETMRTVIWSAVLVSFAHLALTARLGGYHTLVQTATIIRVPFFVVVALFYGYFAQLVRTERSRKAEMEKELNMAKQLRELSACFSQSFDRKQILGDLVNSVLMMCGAQYCAVLSRGKETVLAEAGNPALSSAAKMSSLLLKALERRLPRNGEDGVPEPKITCFVESELRLVQDQPDRVSFSSDQFLFLPLNGQADSDLYLCLAGPQRNELSEYARILLSSASMALNNAGQYQALVHEVEKRQQMVKELREALKFKSEFAANVSHEIRTPIYAFIGFAELLLNNGYGKLLPEQEEIVERMLTRSQGLLDLVNNILEHAKLESGEFKPRPLPGRLQTFLQEIAGTCEPLLKDNPVSLRASCAGDPPPFSIDWEMLRRIALNLVSNAVKFTLKGRVDIEGELDPRGQLRLTVSDTGIGIAKDSLGDIFEPYRQLENSYTKKYAGTGLGLAITKQQVERLGGKIHVESTPGQGSRFIVLIPIDLSLPAAALHPEEVPQNHPA